MSGQSRPCERCGAIIPDERIEALPETRLCVAGSQAVGGEFTLAITPRTSARAAALTCCAIQRAVGIV